MFSLFKRVYSAVAPSDTSQSIKDLQTQLNEKLATLEDNDDEENVENEDEASANDTKNQKINESVCLKKNGE